MTDIEKMEALADELMAVARNFIAENRGESMGALSKMVIFANGVFISSVVEAFVDPIPDEDTKEAVRQSMFDMLSNVVSSHAMELDDEDDEEAETSRIITLNSGIVTH